MDDTITFPGATSVEWDGDTYTADPFGRFTVPGPAQQALVAAGWHIWTPADAPAFGPWVPLLPTLDEAIDQELFPCFVDASSLGLGLPAGLRFRTVGATQVEFGGSCAYLTGPTVPDDLAAPTPGSVVVVLPDGAIPADNGQVALGASVNFGTGAQTVTILAPGAAGSEGAGVVASIGWGDGDGVAVAGSLVYDVADS